MRDTTKIAVPEDDGMYGITCKNSPELSRTRNASDVYLVSVLCVSFSDFLVALHKAPLSAENIPSSLVAYDGTYVHDMYVDVHCLMHEDYSRVASLNLWGERPRKDLATIEPSDISADVRLLMRSSCSFLSLMFF